MRTYNRRFAAMARTRRERGTFGRKNDGQRFMFGGFTFERDGANTKHLAKALLRWGWFELTEGWRSWFVEAPAVRSRPRRRAGGGHNSERECMKRSACDGSRLTACAVSPHDHYSTATAAHSALLLAGLLYWLWPGRAWDFANLPPTAHGPWVAFGDSLTEGYGATGAGADYPSQLGKRLGISIQNHGVSGDTSADGLKRLGEIEALNPRVVLLCFGGNDVLQGLPRTQCWRTLAP